MIFAALYALGCVGAVLMVEQSAVFTTVVQPPLILFVSVPSASWLLRGAGFPGLKNIIINCGYPLIERFPLMLFTSAAVLLLGMARWYRGMRSTPATSPTPSHDVTSFSARLSAMMRAALTRRPAHAIDQSTTQASRRPAGERPRRATAESRQAARDARADRGRARSNGSAPPNSRHVRPQMDPAGSRPRRRPSGEARDEPLQRRPRPAPEARDGRQPRRRPDADWHDDPRRRQRSPADSPRTREPLSRNNRDSHQRTQRPGGPTEQPPRRRPHPTGMADHGNGSGPVLPDARVRYRRNGGETDDRHRHDPRQPREDVESWQFDI